jgi:hypothetical protein
MKRNDKKSKVEEPFPPEKTPQPAQVMNPANRSAQGTENNKDQKKAEEEKPSEKKLGESPIEIDDETTI